MTFKKILFICFLCLLNGSTALAQHNKAKERIFCEKAIKKKKNYIKVGCTLILIASGLFVLYTYREQLNMMQSLSQAPYILPAQERRALITATLNIEQNENSIENSIENCSICKEKVEESVMLFSANCNNKCRFHADCLNSWNKVLLQQEQGKQGKQGKQPHCPSCKTNFNKDNINIIKAEAEAR